jgi:lysine 2,3-aminomutase
LTRPNQARADTCTKSIDAAADAAWRLELREAYTQVSQLVAAGYIKPEEAAALEPVAARYQMRIPKAYAALMDTAHPERCPIRAQALPHLAERPPPWPLWAQAMSIQAFGRAQPWTADAIGDVAHLAAPRLTHRYQGRALMHITTACALYCRFCFRKAHLNSAEAALYDGSLEPAFAYLAAHPKIGELILTGGDPLSMTDAYLTRLLARAEAIGHLHTLRIHSRMATTLPSRITRRLARLLGNSRLHVVLVSHFNHPRELSKAARLGLRRLRRAGVTLLNQAVLLAGINDKAATLARLFEGLYAQGVLPYYLHHADWTPDTFHFRVPIARGRRIMAALQGRVCGPALPRYVVDTPGGGGKVDLMDGRVRLIAHQQQAGLEGRLWRLPLPKTRAVGEKHVLYADFYQRAEPEDTAFAL